MYLTLLCLLTLFQNIYSNIQSILKIGVNLKGFEKLLRQTALILGNRFEGPDLNTIKLFFLIGLVSGNYRHGGTCTGSECLLIFVGVGRNF